MEKKTFTKESLLKEMMSQKDGTFRGIITFIIIALIFYKSIGLLNSILNQFSDSWWLIIIYIAIVVVMFGSWFTIYHIFHIAVRKRISNQEFIDFKKEKINTISKKIKELTKIEKETEILLKEKYVNDIDSHTTLFLCKQNGVLDPQKISTFIFLLQEKIEMYKKRLGEISTSLPISKISQSLLTDENITPQDYKSAIELEFLQQTVRAIEGCISSFQEETLTGDKIDAVFLGNRIQSNIRHSYSSVWFYQYFFKEKRDFLETQELLLLSIVFE